MDINNPYVINLKRSVDRMEAVKKRLNKVGLGYQRFDATDGSKLTEKQIQDFAHPVCYNFFCSKGMIGCAMSHYRLWKKQVAEKKKWMFILEDDANPVSDVLDRLTKIKKMVQQNLNLFDKPSMIYLHCLMDCYNEPLNNTMEFNNKPKKNIVIDMVYPLFRIMSDKPDTHRILKFDDMKLYMGKIQLSFQAYFINYEAAKVLTNVIDEFRMRYHIDFVATMNPSITTYSIYKPLFNSSGEESTLAGKYAFPKFPTLMASTVDPNMKWAVDELLAKWITAGILTYFLFFSILWICNFPVKKWAIGLLMIEFVLMIKMNWLS